LELAGLGIEVLFFLFFVAFVAGFIDTLAGGGGLIALPALIMTGIPPLFALGTNKLQGTMGTATASFMMFKNKKVLWPNVRYLMLSAFIGSALGTIAVQFVNTRILTFVIPVVLLFTAIYFLFFQGSGQRSLHPILSKQKYQRAIMASIGWYDGMFGPGTGSFFALAGVSVRGLGLIDATAVAKTLNFSTNIAALIVFLIAGKVVWAAGLLMMLGQLIGAFAGSKYLFRVNPKKLRLIVVAMCLGMLGKYLFSMGLFT
jgi:uncharacterized membrane protein YfcA